MAYYDTALFWTLLLLALCAIIFLVRNHRHIVTAAKNWRARKDTPRGLPAHAQGIEAPAQDAPDRRTGPTVFRRPQDYRRDHWESYDLLRLRITTILTRAGSEEELRQFLEKHTFQASGQDGAPVNLLLRAFRADQLARVPDDVKLDLLSEATRQWTSSRGPRGPSGEAMQGPSQEVEVHQGGNGVSGGAPPPRARKGGRPPRKTPVADPFESAADEEERP